MKQDLPEGAIRPPRSGDENGEGSAKGPRSPLAAAEIEGIWTAAVAALGWAVERTDAAYALSDGGGRLRIGVEATLDPEDAVAQLIFHELCHGVVEGPVGWSRPDWGLSNCDDRDVIREHACLRVQVHLAERHGLRELMAPTTEFRAYHDQISGDPLRNERDPAATLAARAVERPSSRPWMDVLDRALAETRGRLDASATAQASPDPGALHPVGFAFVQDAPQESCGTCSWLYRGGRGRPVPRCRQSADRDGIGRRTDPRFRACVRWEPPVSCQACGACCREAYHAVTVSVRDPVVWKRAELVVRNGHRFEILRAGDRCAALEERPLSGGQAEAGPAIPPQPSAPHFSCSIYDDRPRPCREFEAGGPHCLTARRRVGLTA